MRPIRAALALPAGALLAGALTPFAMLLPTLFDVLANGRAFGSLEGLGQMLLLTSGVAAVVWAVGMVLIAAPVWAVLHRLCRRRGRHGALLGAVLAGGVYFAVATFPYAWAPADGSGSTFGGAGGNTVENGRMTAAGWRQALGQTAGIMLIGAAAGLLVQRLAYGRERVKAAA